MIRLRRVDVFPAWIVLILAGQPAIAQDTYSLTEDDQWTQQAAPDPGSPEDRLNQARRALARNEFDRAQEIADEWIKRHPNHPLMPDAYLIRGDAKTGQNDEYKALYDYEFLIRAYPGSEAFITALERELQIATQYAAGQRRKLWGMRIAGTSSDAEEMLIRIQERLPGSRLAELAGMELADFYFRRRDMTLAADAYDLFIENYPKSNMVSKARRRLIYAHLAAFKGPQFDSTGLRDAAARLRELQMVEPVTAETIGAKAIHARIDESHAQKLLITAAWYLKTNDPIAAERSIRRLVTRYPRTVAYTEGLRLMKDVLPRLPESVIKDAPPYEELRQGMLGESDGGQEAKKHPVAEPATS